MSLYVKESTLKLFPKLEKDILEVLFADCGFIPSRSQNGKMKSCHIVVNYAGVHFYRPLSLSTSYKKSTICMYPPVTVNFKSYVLLTELFSVTSIFKSTPCALA